MTVSIIDYGMGNMQSVYNALRYLGATPRILDDPGNLKDDKIIIPGVGAFGDAMKNLEEFLPRINEAIDSDTPILGICLGMQVLFEGSEEAPETTGLEALKGKVTKIETNLKLPHIGWNSLNIKKRSCPLFEKIEDGYFYFVHSYQVQPQREVLAATSDYGAEIAASVWKENIFGTQFHPEKSGKLGLKLIKNFLEL